MLKQMLLGLLQYLPMSGYDLEQFITLTTSHFWHAKLSQIYRTLKKMEEEGLVISHVEPQEGRPDRRVYTITEEGLSELRAWQGEFLTELDEFKLPSILKLFLMGRGVDNATILTQLNLLRDMHHRQMGHFQQHLPEEIERIKSTMPHDDRDALFWEATRRFGEMYYAMYVAWLDEAMASFQDAIDT